MIDLDRIAAMAAEQADASDGAVMLHHADVAALVRAVQAAIAYRAEHPAWSPDHFDEDSIGEMLHHLAGDHTPGMELDEALAPFDSGGGWPYRGDQP